MAAGPALTHVKGLRLTLGGAPLFDDVEFVLKRGERAALVGANGAGKSTLMRMVAGFAEPDGGEIAIANGVVIAYAEQDAPFDGFATLRDFVTAPSTARAGSMGVLPDHAAEAELQVFELDPDADLRTLSGGQRRRASLARAFAAEPDLLLLDEPTNHLDIAAIQALEQRLNAFKGACLIISHDRRFLERSSTSMLWLRQRRVLSNDRGFAAFDDWAEEVEREETRTLARLQTHLAAEEHWLRRGVTARRSRNEGRRRKLESLRAEHRERESAARAVKAVLQAERGAESARLVIEASKVSKRYGDVPIIETFSTRIMRGDRVGVVGRNGAGKTTLLELLLKRLEPDQGSVRMGENLRVAYVDQARALLSPHTTIWAALAPQGGDQVVVGGRPRHVAAYAGDFLFRPEQLRQPISALSGGERNRLALAVALAQPANLLVLDEPTNDLDLDTLEALEDMLAAYDGTVIIVSHDRAFLDGVATQIVGPLGGGRWVEHPGGWAEFERAYGGSVVERPKAGAKAASAPAATPRRQTKLSYKDERRAAELDALIPKLAADIDAQERALADPAAFTKDPKAFDGAARRLQALRAQHEAAESEWLDIELRREALGS
ncbi:MAG: ABC-F family ATP-binding cassette domain-containing protein [Hyphomonadaceae bacterium]|nr:ABC-F family ATP-binding cassette domain-containing protein [Hyphomonadaceae bacterium]